MRARINSASFYIICACLYGKLVPILVGITTIPCLTWVAFHNGAATMWLQSNPGWDIAIAIFALGGLWWICMGRHYVHVEPM